MDQFPINPLDAIQHLHHFLALVHEGSPGRTPPDPLVQNVRAQLDARPEGSWNFSHLARKHGTSYSHFRRRFRQQLGLSPHAYLISRRLRQAARYLTRSTLSVKEIGNQIGYTDPCHFSRAFKRCYGLSPRDFRNSSPSNAGEGNY